MNSSVWSKPADPFKPSSPPFVSVGTTSGLTLIFRFAPSMTPTICESTTLPLSWRSRISSGIFTAWATSTREVTNERYPPPPALRLCPHLPRWILSGESRTLDRGRTDEDDQAMDERRSLYLLGC